MECREAADVLRTLGARTRPRGARLDALAGHVTDCELCRAELLRRVGDRPPRTAGPEAVGVLSDAVAECERVRELLRARAASGEPGPHTDPEVAGHLGWCASCARRSRQYARLLERSVTWAVVPGGSGGRGVARVIELAGRARSGGVVLRLRPAAPGRPAHFDEVPLTPAIGVLPAAGVLGPDDELADGLFVALPGSDLSLELWPRGPATASGAVPVTIHLLVAGRASARHGGITLQDEAGGAELEFPSGEIPCDFEASLSPDRTKVLIVRYRPDGHDRDTAVRLPLALDGGPAVGDPVPGEPVPAASAGGSAEAPAAYPVPGPRVAGDAPGEDPATLSVTCDAGEEQTRLAYQLTVPLPNSLRRRKNASVSVSHPVLAQLCSKLAAASLDGEHGRQLVEYGSMLFRMLFQGDARKVAEELVRRPGPLIVSSNETLVPWELLYSPTDGFLGISHAVGRQQTDLEVEGGRPLTGLRTALIVSSRPEDPEDGRRQAEMVRAALPGVDATVLSGDHATRLEVLRALDRQPDLLHYFGHVDVDAGSGSGSLRLSDGSLDAATIAGQMASPGEESGGAPPVVFVNGCESAATLNGVCSAFVGFGATIAIGTLFPVTPAAAATVAQGWYLSFVAGSSAGEALREARHAQVRGRHGGWGAFALFGDPTTRLTEPQADPGSPVGAVGIDGMPWPELERTLTPDAVDLVRTAALMAAGSSRTLTSMHLAAALVVTTGTPIALAVDEAGMPADELARLLCAAEADETAPVGTGARTLEATRNFAAVMDGARQAAEERDGDPAGITDVVGAFMDQDCAGRSALASVDIGRDTLRPILSGDSPQRVFDAERRLRTAYLDRPTRQAVKAAWLAQWVLGNRLVSSEALLVGFGLTDNSTLRGALHEQGEKGDFAVRVLFPQAFSGEVLPPMADVFSPRSRAALQQAYDACRDAGSNTVLDAVVLGQAIADDRSAAVDLLTRCGVDIVRLRAALRDVAGGVEPR